MSGQRSSQESSHDKPIDHATHIEEEEAGELIESGPPPSGSVYAPLENFEKETIAAKRKQLSTLGNKRIWAMLGLENMNKTHRKKTCGLLISKAGEVAVVRSEK